MSSDQRMPKQLVYSSSGPRFRAKKDLKKCKINKKKTAAQLAGEFFFSNLLKSSSFSATYYGEGSYLFSQDLSFSSAMPLQRAYYEGLISLWVTRLAEERGAVGGSRVSPFTLQERSPRGAEGIQSLAQPVGGDTTANTLTSPLIRTWKYLVFGEEREELEIMSPFNSAAVILPFMPSSAFLGLMLLLLFFHECILQGRCIKDAGEMH